MLSADDLRYFLTVARRGRLIRAGEELGVDHTTVGRRITALERSVGQRLFDRRSQGWELTDSGRRLLEPAEAVSAALAKAEELLGGRGAALSGTVRIACPDGFGAFLLAPALSGLRDDHPDLVVELVTATTHLGLSVRDFDVAVTLEKPAESARVVNRYLSPYILRLYAHPDYVARYGVPDSIDGLRDHSVIWYVDHMLDVLPLREIHRALPTSGHIQSPNLVAHWQAAAAGLGIAPLPQFIANLSPDLLCVLPEVEFRGSYWLVLPREHARLARVHALADVVQGIPRWHADDLVGPRRHDIA